MSDRTFAVFVALALLLGGLSAWASCAGPCSWFEPFPVGNAPLRCVRGG